MLLLAALAAVLGEMPGMVGVAAWLAVLLLAIGLSGRPRATMCYFWVARSVAALVSAPGAGPALAFAGLALATWLLARREVDAIWRAVWSGTAGEA